MILPINGWRLIHKEFIFHKFSFILIMKKKTEMKNERIPCAPAMITSGKTRRSRAKQHQLKHVWSHADVVSRLVSSPGLTLCSWSLSCAQPSVGCYLHQEGANKGFDGWRLSEHKKEIIYDLRILPFRSSYFFINCLLVCKQVNKQLMMKK